jgi:hypothetical protein
MHHSVPRCANSREQDSTATMRWSNRDRNGHDEAFQERERSTPCTPLHTISISVPSAQRMMETDRPPDHSGTATIKATSQPQEQVNVVIKHKSAGIARTLKSHKADQSSTKAPRPNRRKSSNRRSSAPIGDDTYSLTDDEEKTTPKTNEESMNEDFKWEDKATVLARSNTEEQQTNYNNVLYVILEATVVFKKRGDYRGQRLEGIGLVKPLKSVVKRDVLTITFGPAKGAMVPINESKNEYACKILGYTMCLYMEKDSTRTPELSCKAVLCSEVAHASQLAKLDSGDNTVDRIIKVLYKIMTGFNSNVTTNNRDLESIVAHFMSMRTGKIPIKGGALKALSRAIDDYYTRSGGDVTVKQRNLAGKGWKIVMIHLINGHLKHHGFKPMPFSPVAAEDIEKAKLREANDKVGGPFIGNDIVVEKDEQETIKYNEYVDNYLKWRDDEQAAANAKTGESTEPHEATAFDGL